MSDTAQKGAIDGREKLALEQIRKALRGLRHGSLTIIIQDGVVIQIDRTSKSRIDYSVLEQVKEGEGI